MVSRGRVVSQEPQDLLASRVSLDQAGLRARLDLTVLPD